MRYPINQDYADLPPKNWSTRYVRVVDRREAGRWAGSVIRRSKPSGSCGKPKWRYLLLMRSSRGFGRISLSKSWTIGIFWEDSVLAVTVEKAISGKELLSWWGGFSIQDVFWRMGASISFFLEVYLLFKSHLPPYFRLCWAIVCDLFDVVHHAIQ